MMKFKVSKHCEIRMQQRSIPEFILELLMRFGTSREVVGRAERTAFSKNDWKEVEAYLGPVAKAIARYRDAYIIVSDDGCVVTASYLKG